MTPILFLARSGYRTETTRAAASGTRRPGACVRRMHSPFFTRSDTRHVLLILIPPAVAALRAGLRRVRRVERDTRALALSDAERFNYYPATPLAVVSWIFEGALHPVQMVGTATGEPALSAPCRA